MAAGATTSAAQYEFIASVEQMSFTLDAMFRVLTHIFTKRRNKRDCLASVAVTRDKIQMPKYDVKIVAPYDLLNMKEVLI